MAIGNMLAGVGGFFDGWKAMDDIIKSHQQMLGRAQQIEGLKAGQSLSDAQAQEMDRLRANPNFGVGQGDIPTGETSGSSTPMPPEVREELKGGSVIAPSDAYKLAIKAGFDPEGAKIITAIAGPESSYDPFAHGDKTLGHSWGITQINEKAHGPVAKEAYGDPARAMELAFKVSKGGTDFTPWTMYRNGEYKKYLNFPMPDMSRPVTPSALGYGEGLGGTGVVQPAATAPVARVAVPPATGPVVAEAAIPPPPATASANRITVPPPTSSGVSTAPAPYVASPIPAAPPGGRVTPEHYGVRVPGSGGGTPAMPGPGAGGNPYNTSLQPTQESMFRSWVKNNKVKFNPDADMTDYDMRGFWQAQQQGDPRARTTYNPDANEVHYPDVWKTPIHKTFSNESQYAPPGAPRWEGGRLIGNDGTVLFDDATGSALGR